MLGRTRFPSALRAALLAATAALISLFLRSGNAQAQQKTFYLDRLTIGVTPEDGIGVWRPVAVSRARLFGQMGLGFTLNPLRMRTIAVTERRLSQAPGAPVSTQLIDYMTAGVEVAERVDFAATLPIALYESGSDASRVGVRGVGNLQATAVGDLRLDLRGVVYRSDNRKFLLGAQISVYAATGDSYSFTGDGAAHTAYSLSAETYVKSVILTANMGAHMRPMGITGNLTVGNEWTWGFAGFYPLREGKYRVGAEVFGSTGIESLTGQGGVAASTFFAGKNTPLELLAEGRMLLDKTQHWWAAGGIGTHVSLGYGAPDLRVLAMLGYWYPVQDSDANSPAVRMKASKERRSALVDTDGDGFPDDVDLCPTEPEDHLDPDPSDGCPKLADRDGDGIPDAFDKCPDEPEDKDGFQDDDGCPDPDNDNDGIPDVVDACPNEPGEPDPDPKKNGCPKNIRRVKGSTEIEILKKIEFDTGKATIKKNSYPILDEVVKLLRANPDIKHLAVEGHTDDRGALDMNNRLSQDRAGSVMDYMVSHGIAAARLEAHGFGPSKPIESNDTADGRQKNRRVEFHITQQETGPTPGALPRPQRGQQSGATKPGQKWDLAPGSEDDKADKPEKPQGPTAPAAPAAPASSAK